MKRSAVIILCVCFAVSSSGMAYASSHSGRYGGRERSDEARRIYRQTKQILRNADTIGLSEDQVSQIRDLKYAFKKNEISKKAEIALASMDLKREARKSDADIDKLNELIDRKYRLKAQRAKDRASARFVLKDVLSEEQCDKLKELRRSSKSEAYHRKRGGRERKALFKKQR